MSLRATEISFFALASICLMPLRAFAQSGGSAAAYLGEASGARYAGLGGAAVSLVDDAFAPALNPAGLTRLGLYQSGLAAAGSLLNLERSRNFLGLARHWEGLGSFGLGIQQFGVGGLEAADELGQALGSFSDLELALGLSYANIIGYQCRYGFTLRGLWQGLESARAWGWGEDFGLQVQPFLGSDLWLGLLLRDPLASLNWDSGRQDRPDSIVKAGLSDRLFSGSLLIAADVDLPLDGVGSGSLHAGAEVSWRGLAARAGLDASRPSFGGGWSHEALALDYAYRLDAGGIGDEQQLSLLLRF